MSFRCALTIHPAARMKGTPKTQTSPLIFASPMEAEAFAQRVFEPPQSINYWKIESVEQRANYRYTGGKLFKL